MDSDSDRVVPLEDLRDFEVAEGDQDVRGWDVISADGRRIGEVDELLVDLGAMKVRYLEVGVDEELLDPSETEERSILIPIENASVRAEDDEVIVEELTGGQVAAMPPYDPDQPPREYDAALREHLERASDSWAGPESPS